MLFRFRLAKTKVWERKFWNLSTKVEKIMPTPNVGLWRSAREPEVWEMWLFTVKLHQYAIKVTENFTMSSLKIPVLKNIPRLHVNIFYSSKEVFTCEFWSAFATSAVSLVGFKASWNLFYWNENVVFVKVWAWKSKTLLPIAFTRREPALRAIMTFSSLLGPKDERRTIFFSSGRKLLFLTM